MLNYNEIKERAYIVVDGEPYEVLTAHIFRKQQRKPVNQTKLRHLITGRVIEQTFQQSDKVDQADVSRRAALFLYANPKKGETWFASPKNPKDRYTLEDSVIGNMINYVPENSEVELNVFTDGSGEEQVIGVRLPIKVDLTVTQAPPAVKGNTATGGDKKVTLETGYVVTVPLFINEGDVVRINTDTGEYVERAEKA